MNIIFLDIDGVLNTGETFMNIFSARKQGLFIPVEIDVFRLEYLKRIVDITNAKIVLVSSWRMFFEKYNDEIVTSSTRAFEFNELLKGMNLELYDILPYESLHDINRGIDIYLREHKEIESFVIIDDEPRLYAGEMQEYIINPGSLGLSAIHVEQALEILGINNLRLRKKNPN